MLEKLLHLYTTAMTHDVRSPMPHLVGPPGTGKSTIVQQAADLLGVHLHIINVNRLSPLEIEGLQMPVDNNTRIHMIPAVFWSRLAEGDIVLFDEYLRGFPEVQDALLDVLTSRRVGAFQLPKVFFVGASNSVIAYDKALEDRLLNIPVQDLRSSAKFLKAAKARFIEEAGLHPDLISSYELRELFDQEVLPTYAMLDAFKDNKTMAVADLKGSSVRNLVGQVKLRYSTNPWLTELVRSNNRLVISKKQLQYLVLMHEEAFDPRLPAQLRKLEKVEGLTPYQRRNLDLNLQLIELAEAKLVKDNTDESEIFE